jgi:hypothetical protein
VMLVGNAKWRMRQSNLTCVGFEPRTDAFGLNRKERVTRG